MYNISDIEKVWPDWYRKDSELSLDDQKFIWENTPLPPEDEKKLKQVTTGVNVNAYENANGSCGFGVKHELVWPKYDLILQLKSCSSKSPAGEVAKLLEEIFKPWPSTEGHWLWIAQTYTVKNINLVLIDTIRKFERKEIKKTPAAYFTYRILRRTKRKI